MNCESLIGRMGFDCETVDADTLKLWSPFTYGEDGEIVGVYVQRTPGGAYRVTDRAEALMHAASMGVRLTERRMEAVRRSAGPAVHVSDRGVISTSVTEVDLPIGIASILNASMAVGHFETVWRPRVRSESFVKQVADVLVSELGDRVLRNYSVMGASGHQLELPLAIRNGEDLTYVQPVAAEDEHVDWGNVYLGFGRMMDLKNAGAPNAARVVVLEDSANDPEVGKAVTLLSEAASVVQYSGLRSWAQRQARAA